MTEETYRIINLKAKNFLKLKAVDITPGNNNAIYITGKNGAGKSSVLKSIWSVFANKEISRDHPSPIREGEETGSVRVDLGDLSVTRTWTAEGSYLKVEGNNGAVYKSPQAILDKLKTNLSFDPLAFTRMDRKEQRATLIRLIGIDTEQLDKEREGFFNSRTNHNRKVNELTAELTAYQGIPVDIPDTMISAADLIKEIREAETNNTKISDLKKKSDACTEYIIQMKKQLSEAEAAKVTYLHDLSLLSQIDVSELEIKLLSIEEINKQVTKKQKADEIMTKLREASKKSDAMTEKIEDIDQRKKGLLKTAAFPIKGLSFDTDGVLLNGLPLSQASTSEQIRVSLSMGMALRPGLRVMLIQDGSLLDAESRAIVEKMAKDYEMQVWIETVDEEGTAAILIEDGEIISPQSS
jgi:DNA repair exonuclease SbcCD ATPase subunit